VHRYLIFGARNRVACRRRVEERGKTVLHLARAVDLGDFVTPTRFSRGDSMNFSGLAASRSRGQAEV